MNFIGIYSNPNVIISYENGRRKYQVVSLSFLCEAMYGEPHVTDEVTEWGYFYPDQLPQPLAPTHLERILDAAAFAGSVFVR